MDTAALKSDTVKIVSLNVWTAKEPDTHYQKEREPVIKKFIENEKPDSFGVQECEPFWEERLSKIITGYKRAQDKTMTKNYIYYLEEKYLLLDTGVFWLSETPDEISKGFGSGFFISCCYAVLKNKQSGAVYVHVNTHIDVTSSEIRMKEMRVLLPRIKEKFRETGYAIVISGDFNSIEESAVIQYIYNSGYKNTVHLTENSDKIGTFNRYLEAARPENYHGPIDFIFVNDKFSVEKTQVIDRVDGAFMSDHNALIAVLRLPG